MSKTTPRAGTSPFANLLAGWTPRGRKAEESQGGDDEEARKARRAEEDKKREEEDARRAEEDERRQEEDARRAEEDDGNDPSEPAPADEKGKKAKGKADDEDQDPEADDDDDDEAEEGMDEKEAKAFRRGLAEGRRREGVRATRIFSSPSAAGRPDLAATLAFTTRNSSAEAERIMGASGSTAHTGRGRGSLDQRMGARNDARPGPNNGGKPASLGQRIAAAARKARGEA